MRACEYQSIWAPLSSAACLNWLASCPTTSCRQMSLRLFAWRLARIIVGLKQQARRPAAAVADSSFRFRAGAGLLMSVARPAGRHVCVIGQKLGVTRARRPPRGKWKWKWKQTDWLAGWWRDYLGNLTVGARSSGAEQSGPAAGAGRRECRRRICSNSNLCAASFACFEFARRNQKRRGKTRSRNLCASSARLPANELVGKLGGALQLLVQNIYLRALGTRSGCGCCAPALAGQRDERTP